MGKIVVKEQPCISPDCKSSDARQVYEEGNSFCFSCREWFSKEETEKMEIVEPKVEEIIPYVREKSVKEEMSEYPCVGFRDRGIKKVVTEFFGVRASFNTEGKINAHYYPYGGDSYKVRRLPKNFSWTEHSKGLFGMDKFAAGGRRLIICEGEIDALSVAQATYEKYGKIYPVVALSSSAMTKSILENREWVRSFEEVVLCFDEDEAGQKAVEEARTYVGIDKVRITKLPRNDAGEVLTKVGGAELLACIWNAEKYIPSGIIGKEELWAALEEYNNKVSIPYPPCLQGVNSKIKGMRGGEIALFISGTGSGKSTILREVMLSILEQSDDRIGVVSLEESPAETARKLAAMKLLKNPAHEEIPLAELKQPFDEVFGDDRVVLLDHQGSINDHSIVDQLEYMALSGCKYLFIDHITILVSEGSDKLTGNEAQDKVMNDLLRLVKRHPEVWVGLVSHLRKVEVGKQSFEEGKMPTLDDVRGSGSIKQISFDIIAFARDMSNESEAIRNSVDVAVLKSRFTGLTGPVDGVRYDFETGRMAHTPYVAEGDDFTEII